MVVTLVVAIVASGRVGTVGETGGGMEGGRVAGTGEVPLCWVSGVGGFPVGSVGKHGVDVWGGGGVVKSSSSSSGVSAMVALS